MRPRPSVCLQCSAVSAATRRLPLLIVIAALAASLVMPLAANAQTGTVPQLAPTVTTPAKSAVKTPSKTPSKTSSTPQLQAQLPNTGVDARILAAVGLALLLCGIGLRMRSSDERF